jgi:hypothetical protein
MARKKPKPSVKKKSAPKPAAKAKPSAPPPAPTIVVLYQLRDVAGVRFHSEHADPTRAQSIARHLISSSDVDQAWIIKDVEVFRAGA